MRYTNIYTYIPYTYQNSPHVFNHKLYDMHSFGMFPFQAHLNYDKFPGNDAVTLNV